MRLAITLFAGFVLAACTTSLAQAAEGSGKITGKVTSAASEAPIAGIEVCAFPKTSGEGPGGGETEEEGTEEELAQCPTTAANGEYTIAGLASGEYIVGFGSPFMGELNYVTQFYNGKSAYAEAQPVTVTAGGTVSGIDAKLAEGGRIAGRVTDASTGAAIERAIVCAFGSNPESGGCAFTNANGEYTITGLVGGEYKVGFADPPQYVVQYYNGKAALSEADAVSVLDGSTVSGIDAALAPKPPTLPPTTALPTGPGTPTGPAKSTGAATAGQGRLDGGVQAGTFGVGARQVGVQRRPLSRVGGVDYAGRQQAPRGREGGGGSGDADPCEGVVLAGGGQGGRDRVAPHGGWTAATGSRGAPPPRGGARAYGGRRQYHCPDRECSLNG